MIELKNRSKGFVINEFVLIEDEPKYYIFCTTNGVYYLHRSIMIRTILGFICKESAYFHVLCITSISVANTPQHFCGIQIFLRVLHMLAYDDFVSMPNKWYVKFVHFHVVCILLREIHHIDIVVLPKNYLNKSFCWYTRNLSHNLQYWSNGYVDYTVRISRHLLIQKIK